LQKEIWESSSRRSQTTEFRILINRLAKTLIQDEVIEEEDLRQKVRRVEEDLLLSVWLQ
jgi:hypothetical protein